MNISIKNIVKTTIIFFFCVALTIVIFVTGAQVAIYSDLNYYQREYEKYKVVDDLNMNMDDVMDVTSEMMDYLIDKRSNLDISTKVNGKTVEFFNSDEKLHMLDVKNIFMYCLILREICLMYMVFTVVLFAVYKYIKGKVDTKKIVKKFAICMISILGVLITALGIVAIYACIDFNSAFRMFHELLFTNELWIMDPDKSLLINMLPEGFFSDMAFRIFGFIIIPYCIVITATLVTFFRSRPKKVIAS